MERPTVLPETSTPGADLTAQFPSTPRGARLARRHAVRWLEALGYPPESDVSCSVALVVGELAANAVQHGRVFGRTVGVRLTADVAAELVRIEVADAAGDRRPSAVPPSASPEGESGRGLLLVDVLSLRWGWTPRRPLGKTVWAELPLKPAEGTTPDPGQT
jgi:anti-sigma regulatory factor (Ser/Thr protein kinase)